MIMRLSLCACSTSSFQRVCSCTTQPAAAKCQTGIVQADDSAKPAGDGQLQHPQKFVMGWMTPFMKDNLLKHGNNNIILLDATFGTNHMKMPLYTALVIDEFGNGVSAFMGTGLHGLPAFMPECTMPEPQPGAMPERQPGGHWQVVGSFAAACAARSP